jgi:CRP/FNR family transcriptional regulator, cyclic AMP receptor protein
VELRRLDSSAYVLEADPELGSQLDPEQFAEASSVAVAVAHRDRGAWAPLGRAEPGHMGFLVLDGLLTHAVGVSGRRSVELLAPGDVLRPWVELGDDAPAKVEVEWTVMEPASFAILDRAFAVRVTPWPEIGCALMDRLVMRARWLALDLAICHVRRVDDRLMLLFWQLANRFGKVTPRGVSIPLPLQHQVIASLIGAQRPSVTTRLGVLRERGLLERQPDGTWFLPDSGGEYAIADLERELAIEAPA